MFYIYILFSEKDGGLYIGFSKPIKQRIKQHRHGEVTSTKNRLPLKLVHYEAFISRKDAVTREKYLKSGYGREQLNSMLKNTLEKLK